jgi:hypothetical protein
MVCYYGLFVVFMVAVPTQGRPTSRHCVFGACNAWDSVFVPGVGVI